MNKREQLKKKIDSITLPVKKIDTSKSPKDYDNLYKPVLDDLGVKSRSDVNMLRDLIDEKVVRMSDDLKRQVLNDLMPGKITDVTKLPLYRDTNGTIQNIPDSFAPWISFEVWLNERKNSLF